MEGGGREEVDATREVDAEEVEQLKTPHGQREWIQSQVFRRRKEYVEPVHVNIFSGTWNVCGNKPMGDLSTWLFNDDVEFDLYAIGLQEVQPLSGMSAVTTDPSKGRNWTSFIQKTLQTQGNYVCICARQMVGIVLLVFVRREHEPFTRKVMIAEVGTGLFYIGGNKGAVAMRCQLYETTLCFVSCHLAAQQNNVSRRNQDFKEVLAKIAFRSGSEQMSLVSLLYGTRDVWTIEDHDLVIFFGDLNYRIDLEPIEVLELIDQKDWRTLLAHDQLNHARRKEKYTFHSFREEELTFAPTYKTAKNEHGYALGENGQPSRPPSWTDRILWRRARSHGNGREEMNGQLNFSAECVEYRRHEVLSSDHRPVSAHFKVTVLKVDTDRRAKILGEVHSELLPNVVLNPPVVQVHRVRLGGHAVANVAVQNEGWIPIDFELCRDDLPPWLDLSPCQGKIFAGEETMLTLCIRPTRERGLLDALEGSAEGEATSLLSCVLKVVVKQGQTLHLTIEGSVQPTLIGKSWKALMTGEETEANVPYVVSSLCKGISQLEGPFFGAETEATEEATEDVLRMLDEGIEIPSSFPRCVVVRILLDLLDWQEEPLISVEVLARLRDADGSERELAASFATKNIPEPNRSIFLRIARTLRETDCFLTEEIFHSLAAAMLRRRGLSSMENEETDLSDDIEELCSYLRLLVEDNKESNC